jgi:hypothetical protein
MTIQGKDLTPRTDAERVICMACASRDFLNSLCYHPDLVDRLEEAGMKFSWIEKTMLKNIRFDQIAPYRVAFMNLESEVWTHYETMAKQLLEQHDYKVPALEKAPEPPLMERTRGIRPGH